MNLNSLLISLFLIAAPTKPAGSPLGLEISTITHLTSTTGVVIPEAVVDAKVGQRVCLYLPNGTCFKGVITEAAADNNILKVYGKAFSHEEVYFGFGITTKGVLGGAIVDRKNKRSYGIEFNVDVKGYIFMYTNQYDKQIRFNY